MPSSDFFSNWPLALLTGAGFGIIQQGFKVAWRLAKVEEQSEANRGEIVRVENDAIQRATELEDRLDCLPRIEVKLEQLFEERHNVIRSSAAV